jgi:hypothetical protein
MLCIVAPGAAIGGWDPPHAGSKTKATQLNAYKLKFEIFIAFAPCSIDEFVASDLRQPAPGNSRLPFPTIS